MPDPELFKGAQAPKPAPPKRYVVDREAEAVFEKYLGVRYEYDHSKTPEQNGILLAVHDAQRQTAQKLKNSFEFR